MTCKKNIMSCFNTHPKSKLKCCVCLEEASGPIVCKHCVEGVVCTMCMSSMCEAGICERCPTCRQTEWKQTDKTSSKITPVGGTSKDDIQSIRIRVARAWEVSNTRGKCEKVGLVCWRCCSFKTWFSILTILTLQWMVGLLVLCISTSNPRELNIHQFTWIALLVGLPIMHLPLWYCMARCDVGVLGPISYIRWILWQYTPN